MEVGVQTPEETYVSRVDLAEILHIDSRFTPLWISSTICIWLYCTIISDVKS
jgi:hypothetical protein